MSRIAVKATRLRVCGIRKLFWDTCEERVARDFSLVSQEYRVITVQSLNSIYAVSQTVCSGCNSSTSEATADRKCWRVGGDETRQGR